MSIDHANLLLAVPSADSSRGLLEQSMVIERPLGTALYEAQESLLYAYFLTSREVSIVTAMFNGANAEVGITGREGAIGSLQLMGPALAPTGVSCSGRAQVFVLCCLTCKKPFDSSEEVRERILEFISSKRCVSVRLLAAIVCTLQISV